MRRPVLLPLALLLVSSLSATAQEHRSWIFQPGRYSHHPYTGDRVAQFVPPPPVQPLPDTRAISSGYHRQRVNQLSPDGTVSTYYRVENFADPRGLLDAEWERFNDVWQQSVLSGGFGLGTRGFGLGTRGFGLGTRGFGLGTRGFGLGGFRSPFLGAPGFQGVPYGGVPGRFGGVNGNPGYGNPGYGFPGYSPGRGLPRDNPYRHAPRRRDGSRD